MVSNSNQSHWPQHIPCHVGIGAIFFVVLLGVYGLTWQTLTALAAPKPSDEFVIEVADHPLGEGRYPDQTVITTNEMPIPLDQPITLRVSKPYGTSNPLSDHPNTIWVETDSWAVYEGQCAESCTRMSFGTIPVPEEISGKRGEQPCHPAVVPANAAAPDNL